MIDSVDEDCDLNLDDKNPKSEEILSCQIVTYNSESTIRACLKSIRELHLKNFKVLCIIIDNASTDNTVTILQEEQAKYPQFFDLHLEHTNLGFSGGHNKALALSQAKGASFITLINPDLCLHPNALIHLREAFRTSYKTGAVCPRLLRADESFTEKGQIIDSTGIVFESSFRHFDRGAGQEANNSNYTHPEFVTGASGACVMFSTDCIDAVSFPPTVNNNIPSDRKEFLDEDFFAYREDAELSLRMQLLGWRTRYEPLAEGYHVRRVTPERRVALPAKINALGVKNRFLMQIQTLSVSSFLLLCPMILLRNAIVILACLIKERSSLIAFKEIMELFPRTLKKRKWTLSRRKISTLNFISHFYKDVSPIPALRYKEALCVQASCTQKQKDLSKKETTPSIHISIVNYLQSKDIETNLPLLIESLEDVPSWTITISNNSPEDTYFDSIKELYKNKENIQFLSNGKNNGFATANNLAFEHSDKEVFLLLNPDISMNKKALHTVLGTMHSYENIGAISPVLLDSETGDIQYKYLAKKLPGITTLFHNLLFLDSIAPGNPFARYETYQDDPLLAELLDRKPLDGELRQAESGQASPCTSNKLYEIEQAAGACLFIPASVYRSLKGLDDGYYPAWFEDVDFAKKIKNAALVSAIHCDAKVKHQGGTSGTSIGRAKLLTYFYKNMARYWRNSSSSNAKKKLAAALVFLCYINRRLILFIKSMLKDKKTDSLVLLKQDIRDYLS